MNRTVKQEIVYFLATVVLALLVIAIQKGLVWLGLFDRWQDGATIFFCSFLH
jgi:hypothetical protein